MRIELLATALVFLGPTRPCAPTHSGSIPGAPGMLMTLPPCCRSDIYAPSPRSFFKPVLTSCPQDTTFLCSPVSDTSMETTMIVINGGETIARGRNGTNCIAALRCNNQKRWQTGTGTLVDNIICK